MNILKKFFNTTGESGETLAEYEKKTLTQNQVIMKYAKIQGFFSASSIAPHMNCPITSVRRGLNTLENAGRIEKTDMRAPGLYGRSEGVYKLLNMES